MEQIAVKAWRFRVFPSDPMPDFEATYFINSNGEFSVNSEFFRVDRVSLQWWQYTTNKSGKRWITFWCGGESFDITEDHQSSIATPFFENHLSHLLKNES